MNHKWNYGLVSSGAHSCPSLCDPMDCSTQASLSITNSRSLLKLKSIESVMPSNHLILCCPLLLLPSIFPSIRVFPMSQFFASSGQSIGVSASASVFLMSIQGLFPLGSSGLISLLSEGLSIVFSSPTVWKHQLFLWLYEPLSFVGKVMSLLFNMLSRFVISFLTGSKHLLISWLHSPAAVI